LDLPASLVPYESEIFLLLTFAVGLFFGLAIKKGLTSIIFIIIGYVVASYIQLPFLPTFDYKQAISAAYSYSTIVHFTQPVVTFGLVIFAIGILFGFWRG
jgi:hypothetical protein